MTTAYRTLPTPATVDIVAPDGSEIRYLALTDRASMVHCTLSPGRVSLAIRHRSVDELWYILEGAGELWRKLGAQESVTGLAPGLSLSIPVGTHFQFRTVGDGPLRFIITTIPPWPGAHEAERVADHWPTSPD